MKICTRCHDPKDELEFAHRAAAKDGLQNYCRECQQKAYRKATSQPGFRKMRSPTQVQWVQRNKEKVAAHRAVRKALKDGSLVRKPCERDDCGAYTEAHHEDYSRPLDVDWLCNAHHKQRHCEIRQMEREAFGAMA